MVKFNKEVASSLDYDSLKLEQKEMIVKFMQGNDACVFHATGFGKSLPYAVLPSI